MVIDESLVGTKSGWRSTCNIREIKDPGGCQKTDSTDTEPREEPRLPRSPRHLHPASRRRSPALQSQHIAASVPPHAGPLRLGWITLACCTYLAPDLSPWRYFSYEFHSRYRRVVDRFGLSSVPQLQSAPPQHPHPADGERQSITGWSRYKKIYVEPRRRHIPAALNVIPSLWSLDGEVFSCSLKTGQ